MVEDGAPVRKAGGAGHPRHARGAEEGAGRGGGGAARGRSRRARRCRRGRRAVLEHQAHPRARLGRSVACQSFPRKEWCEEADARWSTRIPRASPRRAGWTGDFGAVIEAEPGKLDEALRGARACPEDGRIEQLRVLADPDDLDEIEPAYLARAPYSVWKGLLQGTLDPVEAVLKRAHRGEGRRAAADRADAVQGHRGPGAVAQLETQFIDEVRAHGGAAEQLARRRRWGCPRRRWSG